MPFPLHRPRCGHAGISAGHNRVAMLLFRLGDAQLFGINVIKGREVMRRPPLERMTGAHALVGGSCDCRG
ncbi:hypothetical protein BV497_15340, partial [Fulvimonas soli]